MTNYTASYKEMHYRDDHANSDKFYRAYIISNRDNDADHRVLFQWGRRGAKGQSQVAVFHNLLAANAAAYKKLDEKERKGYIEVSQGDLDSVPADLLEQAGINLIEMPTAVDTNPAEAVFVDFAGDVDRCRRLAMGTPEEQANAFEIRNSLRDKLDYLRSSVAKSEGQLEFVEEVLHQAMETA